MQYQKGRSAVREEGCAVAGQGMWCEKKVGGIKNITPAIQG